MSHRLNDPKYLVGYWKLNNNVLDYSGHGNDGFWSGTEAYVEGPFGKSIVNLNGASYVRILDDPAFDVQSFSLSINAKSETLLASEGFISKRTTFGSNDEFNLYSIASGAIVFRVAGDSGNQITTSVLPINYRHVVATFNYSTLKMNIYVDGELNVSGTNGSAPTNAAAEIQLGSLSGGSILDGQLSNARIYSCDLTQDEIKKLYLMEQR